MITKTEVNQIPTMEKMGVGGIELLGIAKIFKILMKTYIMTYFVMEKVVKVEKKRENLSPLMKGIKMKKKKKIIISEENQLIRADLKI